MKQLKLKNFIYIGALFWTFGLCVLITTLIFFACSIDLIFNNEEWIGFGLVCFAITNFINFVMYLPFYFKNKKILTEIENKYIEQVSKGGNTFYFLAWNPFSMKWFKYLVVSKSKKFCKDELVWNLSRKDYWEDYANLQAKIATFTLIRPIYMIFVFSIQSFLKLSAIKKYMNERKEA